MGIATTSIEDALAGDQRAFMELLEPELKAWKSFGRFRRTSELRPWLFTIVANECRRRRRSRWWSVIRVWRSVDEGQASVSTLDPATADLRRALNRLPHDQRLVLVLRYYLDLSFEEVAETLGVSTKAAMSRTYRALERLRMTPEVLDDE